MTETLEQLADVGLGRVLGQVGDTESGLLVALLAASVAACGALAGTSAEVRGNVAGSASLLIGLGNYFSHKRKDKKSGSVPKFYTLSRAFIKRGLKKHYVPASSAGAEEAAASSMPKESL